ncbi:hypothetical protein D3C80_2059330 [compost metagenome]
MVNIGSKLISFLENCPNIPDIELTRIKKLLKPAMFFAVSKWASFNNGDKNIPPPIPVIPDKPPIKPPAILNL